MLCWWQYVLAAVLRSGGYSRKELEAKDKEELYKLRIAALKRMVRGMDRQLKYLDTLTPTVIHEKMKS